MAAISTSTVSTAEILSDKTKIESVKSSSGNDYSGDADGKELAVESFQGVLSALAEDLMKDETTGSDLPVATEAANDDLNFSEDVERQDAALLVMNIDVQTKKILKETPEVSASSLRASTITDQGMLNNQRPEMKKELVTLAIESQGEALEIDLDDSALTESETLFVDRMKLSLSDRSLSPASISTQAVLMEATAASQNRTAAAQLSQTPESTSLLSQQATIPEEFGSDKWGQGLAKQMLWLSNQNVNSAELRLNPANLGPIEVRIDVEDKQINVSFNSRNAAVREAVEQAMPRLREMFENSGLNLAEANVSQHSFAEQREQPLFKTGSDVQMLASDELSVGDEEQTRVIQTGVVQSMVDYYV